MKREGIGISYPTQTAPSNFKMLKHLCEVLTELMINGEVLEARANVNQMRKCYKAGKDRKVNIKVGYIKDMKETFGKEAKRNM